MAGNSNLTPGGSGERVLRLVRPSVVVLCGPAACGKSTFLTRHFRPTQIVSSDECRRLVCDDERDQRFQTQAFALLHFLIEQRLSINRLCVVDSTALIQSARRSLLERARKYQVPCVALVFDVPLETCVARDQGRGEQAQGRAVGRAVIERQYRLFEETKATIAHEGFDQIEVLRDDELERARFEIVFRPAPRIATETTRRPASQPYQRTGEREKRFQDHRQPSPGSGPTSATPISPPGAGAQRIANPQLAGAPARPATPGSAPSPSYQPPKPATESVKAACAGQGEPGPSGQPQTSNPPSSSPPSADQDKNQGKP